MPKRSEKRDTAKAEYIARKARGEEVSLRELAKEQGVGYQFNPLPAVCRRGSFSAEVQHGTF